MAVRNSRPRVQCDYIFADYKEQRFMLCLGSFQTKGILYTTRKKLLDGKIEIPFIENPQGKTILITCSKEDGLKFELL
jgi:hypothetical protein